MLRLALHMGRGGPIWITAFGVFLGLSNAAGFSQLAGRTPAQRAAFGQSMTTIGQQVTYLLPLPIRPDTVGGFLLWRGFGTLVVGFAVWALLAAAGATRGEEERGLIEQWLSAGAERARLLAVRFVAFAITATAAVAVIGLACLAGAAGGGTPLDAGALAGQCAALLALTLACYGLTLLVAQQLTSFRSGAAAAGAVLAVLFFLNSLTRTNHQLDGVRNLSPFRLYERTDVLAPGGQLDVVATLVLVAVGIVATALAAVVFRTRDVGAPFLRWMSSEREARLTASTNPLVRIPVLRGLWEQRLGLATWALGMALLAALLTSLVKSEVQTLMSIEVFRRYLQGQHGDPNVVILGLYWFTFAALLVAVFTVIQVARWAADDLQGRLELVLARPVARWKVIAERALTLAAEVAIVAAAGSTAVAVVTTNQDIHVDAWRLVGATALLLPVALTFGAVGAAFTSWLPRAATSVLAAVAVLSYFLQQLGPLFQWPDWLQNLSLFKLYGTPLSAPIFWNGLYAMIAATVVGFGIAVLAMQRREVGR